MSSILWVGRIPSTGVLFPALRGTKEGQHVLLGLALSQVTLIQNNQYAKVAYLGRPVLDPINVNQQWSQHAFQLKMTLWEVYFNPISVCPQRGQKKQNLLRDGIFAAGPHNMLYIWSCKWGGAVRDLQCRPSASWNREEQGCTTAVGGRLVIKMPEQELLARMLWLSSRVSV